MTRLLALLANLGQALFANFSLTVFPNHRDDEP